MEKLLDFAYLTVESSNSVVSFEQVFDSPDSPNGRFLRLDGKRAYYLGTGCDTCPLLFERLNGANQKVSPAQVSEKLRQGITRIDDVVLGAVQQILPMGEYILCLLNIKPSLTTPGKENDYFCQEQIDIWGIDSFWGLPHHPKVKYYRSLSFALSNDERLYEFEVPLYPENWLEAETVSQYQELLRIKNSPTALAISVVEIRQPAMSVPGNTSGVDCHWNLVHYLLDGHHKTNAAAREGVPLTLLACISLEAGTVAKQQVEQVLEILKEQSV